MISRIARHSLFSCALLMGMGCAAQAALPAGFPAGSERVVEVVEPQGSYALPIGPWIDGSMLSRRTEGRLAQSAWRVEGESTLAIFAPLRDALRADGWQILYECNTQECGGFDFRYATQVLPEPQMHVDLGDFRFVSARHGRGERERHLSLLVSRSSGAGMGYVQMIHVGPAEAVAESEAEAAPPEPRVDPAPPVGLAQALSQGAVVLEGVTFASGASDSPQGGEEILRALADHLLAHPDRSVGLVGHTDVSGSLEANVALSRRRAEAVRQRLIRDFAVPARQLSALGAGFMSPRDSNQTPEGRARNRRVEAILTSYQ